MPKNVDLTWLEKKNNEFLVIHRHELREQMRFLSIKADRYQRKIKRIGEILDEREVA